MLLRRGPWAVAWIFALTLGAAACAGGGGGGSRGASSGSQGGGVPVAPAVTSVLPSSAAPGAQVSVVGNGFGDPAGTLVLFGGRSAGIVAASPTLLSVVVPNLPVGATTLVVKVAGISSAPVTFTVAVTGAAAPAVTFLSPTTGPVGTVVTATGTGFGATPSVDVGGVVATVSAASSTRVVFQVPAGVRPGATTVVVTGPGGASPSRAFTVTQPSTSSPAVLTSISPTSGPVGTAVVARGSGFGTAASVTVAGQPASVSSSQDTEVRFSVPTGLAAGGVDVVVAGPGGASSARTFTVTVPGSGPAASLVRVDPPGGVVGQLITVRGAGFGGAAPTVRFQTALASVVSFSERSVAVRVPSGLGAGQTTITLTPAGASAVSNALFFTVAAAVASTGPRFSSASPMNANRTGHTATLLADGTVLIAGGDPNGLTAALATAEVFSPTTGLFTSTRGSMSTPRQGHTATRLPDGRVLLAGGFGIPAGQAGFQVNFSTDLYDPATRTFTRGPDMAFARDNHQAITLADGDVLLVGGEGMPRLGGSLVPLKSAERYRFDPSGIGSFIGEASMMLSRLQASAIPSFGGAIVAGGQDPPYEMQSVEVSDLSAGTWTKGDPGAANPSLVMNLPRVLPRLVRLDSNDVAVYGGFSPNGLDALLGSSSPQTLEVMPTDPLTNPTTAGHFQSPVTLPEPRVAHTATVLSDGKVLLAGSAAEGVTSSLFAAQHGTLLAADGYTVSASALTMRAPRFDHTATLLFDGRVLLTGGGGNATAQPGFNGLNVYVTASAELFTP